MSTEDVHALVLDHGSSFFKAGIAGNHSPRVVFPSVIGQTNQRIFNHTWEREDFYVGNEAQTKRDVVSLSYPIKDGSIKNWDDMEKIWHHTLYNELRVSPEEYAVLIAEPTSFDGNDSVDNEKERIAEIFFEKFRSPALYFADQSVLSLYASGRTSGVILDISGSYSKSVPIIDGQLIKESSTKVQLGGNDLDEFLFALLSKKQDSFGYSLPELAITDIKERFCYVALDYATELNIPPNYPSLIKSYTLPDGQTISFSTERFISTESLFKPSMINKSVQGLHHLVFDSVMDCKQGFRHDMLNNIVVCGGTSLLPGLSSRIQREVRSLAPSNTKVRMITERQQKYLAWVGGSILASLSTFHTSWITNNKFEEISLSKNTY